MEARISYQCVAAAHRESEGGGPDKLTVYKKEWAYCAFDARAEGHEWKAEPGLTLSMLGHAGQIRPADGKGPSVRHEERTSQQR